MAVTDIPSTAGAVGFEPQTFAFLDDLQTGVVDPQAVIDALVAQETASVDALLEKGQITNSQIEEVLNVINKQLMYAISAGTGFRN